MREFFGFSLASVSQCVSFCGFSLARVCACRATKVKLFLEVKRNVTKSPRNVTRCLGFASALNFPRVGNGTSARFLWKKKNSQSYIAVSFMSASQN